MSKKPSPRDSYFDLETAKSWWEALDPESQTLTRLSSYLRGRVAEKTLVSLWNDSLFHESDQELVGVDLTLFQASILLLGERRSLDQLGALLSLYLPDRIGYHMAIELFLAGLTEPPADGLTPLFDAWDKTDNPVVRQQVVGFLHRAQLPVDIKTSDESYVTRCRAWLEGHRNELQLNHDYVHKLLRPPATWIPLFRLADCTLERSEAHATMSSRQH